MKSKLGFIAIDLDGTALVEKIDKNPLYGVQNNQSHLRNLLVEYVLLGQKAGFDILILTARPELVEHALKRISLGTKPTKEIKESLEKKGIEIKQIARSPAGLKGGMMQDLLDQYRKEGSDLAIGILFDDQLKQVADVKKQKNPYLIAFDINSKKNLEKYASIIGISEQHYCHPSVIVKRSLEINEHLNALKSTINNLDANIYSDKITLFHDLLDDLCIRIDEALLREYQPEIDWVNKTGKYMHFFIDKLQSNSIISHEEILKASKDIFGTSSLDKVVPNSSCDKLVKDMLLNMRVSAVDKSVTMTQWMRERLTGGKNTSNDVDLEHINAHAAQPL